MTAPEFSAEWEKMSFENVVIAFGRRREEMKEPRLVSHPMLSALRDAGTSHLYGDTADAEELYKVLATENDSIYSEVDGNTVNQPLVHKVLVRYLEESNPMVWAREMHSRRANLEEKELLPLLYTIVCGRVGNDFVHRFAGGRNWEISLQLHMGICQNMAFSMRVGRYLKEMVPTGFVKVPFLPHAPHCFLIARDLERAGIPVNFTSTFSSRQIVAAALLANVSRTNIFIGRIDEGFTAEFLGAHVCLEAQRLLAQLRQEKRVKTLLIVASMREWQSFVHTTGCDVYTAPCNVIEAFMKQTEVSPPDLRSQLETSYEDRLGVPENVFQLFGQDRIARFYRVEPELIEFLLAYRETEEFRSLSDGERLFRRFEEAGFGDVFYSPGDTEWTEIRKSKIPAMGDLLETRMPADTAYSLHADGDFERHQEDMDSEIRRYLKH